MLVHYGPLKTNKGLGLVFNHGKTMVSNSVSLMGEKALNPLNALKSQPLWECIKEFGYKLKIIWFIHKKPPNF
jgi:hypothetical protein